MRQYTIFYMRGGMSNFKRLDKLVDHNLYDRAEVQDQINYIRRTPSVEGVAVRVKDELFNIMAFESDTVTTDSFPFEDKVSILEPIDSAAMLKDALACYPTL